MMRTSADPIRYQIIAQYPGNKLMIHILGEGLYFIRSAHQILHDPMLLNGFSQEEAALIGYIAGTEQITNQHF
jgi:hypothetical protein